MSKHSELTPIEAARKLGIGLDYLYGLLWVGKIQARKVDNRWRVSAESVEAHRRNLRSKSYTSARG